MERCNRYLRESFYNPLASRLKSAGRPVDATTANHYVQKWLAVLTPLPAAHRLAAMPRLEGRPVPVESLQPPVGLW